MLELGTTCIEEADEANGAQRARERRKERGKRKRDGYKKAES